MHKLSRDNGPNCLAKYKHGQDSWSNTIPSVEEKAEIWDRLEAMQGPNCAYCEASIALESNRHIEHFRQRAPYRYPQGTFEWANIFGSCNRKDGCGKHKDEYGEYNHADLIKPDIEDPELFFNFHSDGSISLRHELNEIEKHRALKTLSIFNLNPKGGAICWQRKGAASGYIETAEVIIQCAESREQAEELILEEIEATRNFAFSTAIKHTLQIALMG